MYKSFVILKTIVVLMVLLSSGCGPKLPYEVVPVSGTVTWQGKPLEQVEITFKPEQGRPSTAIVQSDGKFEAKYRPGTMGVQKGKCRVTVSLLSSHIGSETKLSKAEQTMIQKYGFGSAGYELEITKPEKNLIIDLK